MGENTSPARPGADRRGQGRRGYQLTGGHNLLIFRRAMTSKLKTSSCACAVFSEGNVPFDVICCAIIS